MFRSARDPERFDRLVRHQRRGAVEVALAMAAITASWSTGMPLSLMFCARNLLRITKASLPRTASIASRGVLDVPKNT